MIQAEVSSRDLAHSGRQLLLSGRPVRISVCLYIGYCISCFVCFVVFLFLKTEPRNTRNGHETDTKQEASPLTSKPKGCRALVAFFVCSVVRSPQAFVQYPSCS